jgi:hypothetical protein
MTRTLPRGVPPLPELPRRIVVSLAIGALAFLLSDLFVSASQEHQVWGLTMSVFLGGIALVTQLLTDLERRLAAAEHAQREHTRDVEALLTAGFARVTEATELFDRVTSSALPADEVFQLVRRTAEVDGTAQPLTVQLARAELARVSQFVKEMQHGTVHYDGEDRDWMLALTREAATSIDSTSLTTVGAGGGSVDGGLWTSDLGQRYLNAQQHAIRRGVRIRRVFVLGGDELHGDEEFREICRRQRDMGVEVRLLDRADVPALHRSALFDFVLFDDTICYEVTPASRLDGHTGPTILTTSLELRPGRVHERIQRFRELWESARETTG